MVVNLFKIKWLANYHLLDVEGNLLVLVYIHGIFPPTCFYLVLSLIMPCTLVHPFVFFDNASKT
jgi:hypothetical protein